MLQRLKKWFSIVENTEQPHKQSERLIKLEKSLGFTIPHGFEALFLQALRHRSIIDDNLYHAHETYERLEFLGDAVIDLIITEILYKKYKKEDEGFLTKLRAKLVKGDTLAKLANDLNINELLEIGERATGQKIDLSKSVLSDLFESVVAAIYLSKGYQFTFNFVHKVIEKHLDFEQVEKNVDNHKSVLMEYLQALKKPLPEYKILSEDGPGHDKTFVIAVYISDEKMGVGEGKSKKEAEQSAAKKTLEILKK